MEVRDGGEGWGVRVLPAASASCMRLLLSGLSGRFRQPMQRQRAEQEILAWAGHAGSPHVSHTAHIATYLIAFTVVFEAARPLAVAACRAYSAAVNENIITAGLTTYPSHVCVRLPERVGGRVVRNEF